MSAKSERHQRSVTIIDGRYGHDRPMQYVIGPGLQILGNEGGPVAEAFRHVAGEVVQGHLGEGRRGLALCGPSAGAGVTFSAVNLAAVLARIDVHTLLIEGDLRAPGLHKYIMPSQPCGGLRQVLTGELSLDAALHHISPNLSLLFAGGRGADASELLSSLQAEQIFDGCMRNFDCVLADTPPTNRSSDGLTVATALGYAVVVGRRVHSYVEDAALLSRQLKQARVQVVGTIFNGG